MLCHHSGSFIPNYQKALPVSGLLSKCSLILSEGMSWVFLQPHYDDGGLASRVGTTQMPFINVHPVKCSSEMTTINKNPLTYTELDSGQLS